MNRRLGFPGAAVIPPSWLQVLRPDFQCLRGLCPAFILHPSIHCADVPGSACRGGCGLYSRTPSVAGPWRRRASGGERGLLSVLDQDSREASPPAMATFPLGESQPWWTPEQWLFKLGSWLQDLQGLVLYSLLNSSRVFGICLFKLQFCGRSCDAQTLSQTLFWISLGVFSGQDLHLIWWTLIADCPLNRWASSNQLKAIEEQVPTSPK